MVVTPVTATLDLDRNNHILGASPTWPRPCTPATPQPRRVLLSAFDQPPYASHSPPAIPECTPRWPKIASARRISSPK